MEKITFDLRLVENICKLMPTWEELAVALNVSLRTVHNYLANDPEFKDATTRGFEKGKMRLRRWQMRAAQKGSAALLIFLGKNHLGQKYQVDQVVTGTMTQAFTLKAPHEYRIPQASTIPEAITSDLPYEEIRPNGSNH